MGFSGDFGGRGEDIWWESTSVLRIAHLQTSLVQICSRILYRHKFGQVWGSPAPLPEVAEKLRCRKALLWTFDYHIEKSELFCDV